jgi:Spy/CpxP family protein refolding chaperone
MIMKPILFKSFLLSIFVFSTISVFSQMGPPPPPEKGSRQEKRENIEALKVAFITKKLDLTPEEAQQFWPIYNQYTDRLQDIRKKRRQENKEKKQNFDEMSDKEIEQAVDNEIIFRQKELDLQKEYHSKFKAVLPIKKVARLYQAEEQFKRVLLDKLKDGGPPVKE